jgi:hypothetical protein
MTPHNLPILQKNDVYYDIFEGFQNNQNFSIHGEVRNVLNRILNNQPEILPKILFLN